MSDRPAPGARLVFRWRKWDGSPHRQHDRVYLGSDRWGDHATAHRWPAVLARLVT